MTSMAGPEAIAARLQTCERPGLCTGPPLWVPGRTQRTGRATQHRRGRTSGGRSTPCCSQALLASPLPEPTSAVSCVVMCLRRIEGLWCSDTAEQSLVFEGSQCLLLLYCHTQARHRASRCHAGFQNIATAELCARWIAVGAWQPFTRDHHAQSFQELYRSASAHSAAADSANEMTAEAARHCDVGAVLLW